MATHAGGGGGAATASRHRHKFFKILLPGSFEISLSLPPKFAADLARHHHGHCTATLRNPAGRPWAVDLQQHRSGGTTFFSGRGWRGFVSGNGISAGDMLAFEHRGGLDFAVDLFDPSGCLKTTDDNDGSCRDKGCHEGDGPTSLAAAKRVVQEQRNDPMTVVTGGTESGNGGPEAPPCAASRAKRRRKQPSPPTSTATTASCEEKPLHDETLLCRRIEKPYQLRLLDVSKSFCDRVGWTASCNVELCRAASGDVTTTGRRWWSVSVKVTAKGGMLCGGWAEFANDNGLRLSDACVFLPSDDDDHVFQVHILKPTP